MKRRAKRIKRFDARRGNKMRRNTSWMSKAVSMYRKRRGYKS